MKVQKIVKSFSINYEMSSFRFFKIGTTLEATIDGAEDVDKASGELLTMAVKKTLKELTVMGPKIRKIVDNNEKK